MPAPFNDPNLQTLSIADFTPGIVRWSRTGVTTNYPSAPPGSAANAFRCWAKPDIGLLPLPTYRLCQQFSVSDATHPTCLALGNMMTLAARGGSVGDLVCAWMMQVGTGGGILPGVPHNFYITRLPIAFSPLSPTLLYGSTSTVTPFNTTTWPMMDFAVFQDPTTHVFRRTVITTDPISTSFSTGNPGKWVCVPGWTTPTTVVAIPELSTGTFPLTGLIGSYPRIFYHGNRVGIWQVGASETTTNNFVASDCDELYTSGLLNPTTLTDSGTFFPEMGTTIGAWGSWSTGEFVGIYSEGGAIMIYGDLFAPSTVYKMSGVMGTAGAIGRAALTPIGMIYPRAGEGVYLWNGDNVSQKISRQLPEGLFTRNGVVNGFYAHPLISASTQTWGEWVAFPNNWMFDTVTQSWWQLEDPTVMNFQVHCGISSGTMFSSPAISYAAAGEVATVNTYFYDKNTAVSNYYWLSNPLPVTVGALVSIQNIEIIATNWNNAPATITIVPQTPAAVTPFANQTQTQPLTFTLPPQTSNYRASRRLGYADYNVQLAVTADAGTGRAPTLHAINIGYTTTRTTGIQ